MIDNKRLNELSERLANAVPESVKKTGDEIKQSFIKILQTGFSKLDFVTREEFDVQTKVLARTREKLTTLEKQLTEFEEKQKAY
ncbi:MAG: accessory factor UbiK family protein [Gammaproteobacteria bacterium]|nr:accessory factor UbiK family protein [Gammaproteobacteria bacterium]